MEQLNINQLLNRNQNEEDLIHFLNHFEENKHNLLIMFMVIQVLVKLIL